jgi:hypothetical protein
MNIIENTKRPEYEAAMLFLEVNSMKNNRYQM